MSHSVQFPERAQDLRALGRGRGRFNLGTPDHSVLLCPAPVSWGYVPPWAWANLADWFWWPISGAGQDSRGHLWSPARLSPISP